MESAVEVGPARIGGLVKIRLSAPGKVILFGEHAVVYGKTALAASLGLRSQLSLRELPTEELGLCEIEMMDIGLSCRLSVDRLRRQLIIGDEDGLRLRARDEAVQLTVQLALEPAQARSLECLLYALARVARAEGMRLARAFRLELRSELPLGAGLGSSAALCVCLVSGFLLWARLRRGAPPILDAPTLRQIAELALACEAITHGAPSGVDTEICTFGSLLEFRKMEGPILRPLPANLADLRVLLVDSGVSRSTGVLVNQLASLSARCPDVFIALFECMDRVCRRVVNIIGEQVEHADLQETCRQLSVLVDVNQGLLVACQVSHPSIDSICAIAKKHDFSAKLTGAGGGGFAYVLILPGTSAVKLQNITGELSVNGFSVIETTLGGSGLQIHNASIV